MFSLIKKDIRAFYHIAIFQLIIILGIMSFGLFVDQKGTLIFLAVIIYPATFPILFLINDEKYYYLSNVLPISRFEFVFSKYIVGFSTAFLLAFIGMGYGWIVTHYIIMDGVQLNVIYSLEGYVMVLVPTIVINSFLYPIFLRFSTLKGSYVLIGIIALIGLGFIIGLVSLEKSIVTDTAYTHKDVFPVLIERISQFIRSIGRETFQMLIVLSTASFLILSMLLSLLLFKIRDLGGAR